MYTKDQVIQAIVKGMPYPDQIKDWDTTQHEQVRFSWRNSGRFRVSCNGMVEEVGDGVLISSDITIFIEASIKRHLVKDFIDTETVAVSMGLPRNA